MSLKGFAYNSKMAELNSSPFRAWGALARAHGFEPVKELIPGASLSADEKEPEGDDALGEAGRDEREYVRRRLRDELGREPSEEEVNEWLRRHTEGY